MYYPIFRWKAGEKLSLKNIPTTHHLDICPIWRFTTDDSIESFFTTIDDIWQGTSILDFSKLSGISSVLSLSLPHIKSGAYKFFVDLNQLIEMGDDLRATFTGQVGLLIPLKDNLSSSFHQEILSTLHSFGISSDSFTLLFDYSDVSSSSYSEAPGISTCINYYLSNQYNSLIFSSGAFPLSIAFIGAGQEHIVRADKKMWELVQDNVNSPLFYSDYGTISPIWNPGRGIPYSNIRYTIDDHWYILRDDQRGKESTIALTSLLLMSDEYKNYTSKFSWADKSWEYKVENNDKPGGPKEHVAESLNHHIMHVILKDQV